MTPLAQYLLNDWCKPKAKREVCDEASILPLIQSAKCFDCTDLNGMMAGMGVTRSDIWSSGRVFLPAEKTWFEFNRGQRNGFLLTHCKKEKFFAVIRAEAGLTHPLLIFHPHDDAFQTSKENIEVMGEKYLGDTVDFIVRTIFLINTPRIVGKKVHQPHAGLQRKLAAAQGMTGKFPLHAWTEIKLWCDADDISEIASDKEIEAHFTGQRCLHFVRSFLRWRNSKLERVKAHWRGNPALGMRRSRYICEPRSALQ